MFRRSVVRGIEEFWRPGTVPGILYRKDLDTGRAWTAAELRNKSFDDLHKLWFVCVKERNLLETQRRQFQMAQQKWPKPGRLQHVKKTMARIKLVVGERRRTTEPSLPEV